MEYEIIMPTFNISYLMNKNKANRSNLDSLPYKDSQIYLLYISIWTTGQRVVLESFEFP